MILTKRFAPEVFARALESWTWVGLENKVATLSSLFGDIFLQDREGYWFLDSLEGNLTRIAASAADLQRILDTQDGQDQYLLGGLAEAAARRGLVLGADQVYDFNISPVLGGALDPANITVRDFVVSLNIAGQIHKQIRDLPPGTKINRITIDGKEP